MESGRLEAPIVPDSAKLHPGYAGFTKRREAGGGERMLDQIMRIIIIRIMEDASSWVP